jgi:hypothetical protein
LIDSPAVHIVRDSSWEIPRKRGPHILLQLLSSTDKQHAQT